MVEPVGSDYDTDPVDPEAEGEEGEENPDKGKELDNLVPEVEVAWDTSPTYNQDPPEQGGSDPETDQEGGDTKVDLTSLRDAESTILGAARTAVSAYEALRAQVMADQDTVFGQESTKTEERTVTRFAGGAPYQETTGSETVPSDFQETAKEFAGTMNPAQERALSQIAAALVQVGDYVALVNRAGQSYGKVDRSAAFPAPPGTHSNGGNT